MKFVTLCLLSLLAAPLGAQSALSPDSLDARWVRAIDNDDLATIADLVGAGADVQGTGRTMAPLYRASRQGRLAIAQLLIVHGADVNLADPLRGTTPLHAATYFGYADLVNLLIDAGADLHAESPIGFAAFDWALESERNPMTLLILNALSSKAVSPRERDALDLMYAVVDEDGDRLEALLNGGADPTAYSRTGYNALAVAARLGHLDMLNRLLEAGADPNAANVDLDEAAPLLQAARGGHTDVGRRLLEAGANLRHRNARGFTALFMTALYGRSDFALLLLDAGLDPTIRSSDPDPAMDDYAALDYAFEQTPAIIPVFLEWWALDAAANETERRFAEAVSSGTLTEEQLAAIPLQNLASDYGVLLLALAASHNAASIIPQLIAASVDPDRMNPSGYPALVVAARLGNLESVRALLGGGADPDVLSRSRYDTFALAEAARENNLDIARALLDGGASVDLRDRYGDTALTWATSLTQPEYVGLLLERGATRDYVGRSGETALQMARRLSYPRIVALLEAVGE